ncbi:LSM domain [Nesidiocoris tenuis]|uniref:LSM domain n=1 Tax=Nesidiocoris tenuis TaxID=355587 RepID=A0ABN7AM46_9HEMI|nr:LSM domain [Nesidiocoris tenuis]
MKWMRGIDGPMKLLRVWMETKAQVKIVTRNAETVRGHVIGYITAFDKVWNLAVEEATEIWTRRRLDKRKILPVGENSAEIPPDTAGRRMKAPLVQVKNIGNGMELCERKVDKILLKGEHIVLVSKIA